MPLTGTRPVEGSGSTAPGLRAEAKQYYRLHGQYYRGRQEKHQ
jgi:hypothetical protein